MKQKNDHVKWFVCIFGHFRCVLVYSGNNLANILFLQGGVGQHTFFYELEFFALSNSYYIKYTNKNEIRLEYLNRKFNEENMMNTCLNPFWGSFYNVEKKYIPFFFSFRLTKISLASKIIANKKIKISVMRWTRLRLLILSSDALFRGVVKNNKY